MMYIFLVLSILLIVIGVYFSYKRKAKINTRRPTEESEFFNATRRTAITGIGTRNVRTAENAVSVYAAQYDQLRKKAPGKDLTPAEEELSEMIDNRDDLRREEWIRKANKIMDKFERLFDMITNPAFSDLEEAYRSKTRCLKYRQDYFASVPHDDGTFYGAKEHLRKMPWYEPCMESSDALDKRLTEAIELMKPEYKRKLDLKKRMTGLVAEKGTILRADLMKTFREEGNEPEAKYCYKELIEKNILSEVKYSNRYLVSLSEKEKAKRQKAAAPASEKE